MNPRKALKRARHAIRQADNALKEAASALRSPIPGEEATSEKPDFLAKTFTMPAATFDGMADAAAALRQRGPSAFKHGDEIKVFHQLGKLRFVVIGIDHDKSGDRDHTLTLLLTSIVLGSAFDAPSLSNPWGRNCWHLSSIRRLLNGKFLDGFTEADQQAISHTYHRTYSFTEREYIHTYDKFFLLSASEAGFEVDEETVMDEGDVCPYFKTGSESRQLLDAYGTAHSWWLRSPNPCNGYLVRYVTPSGALSHHYANNGLAVAAVCVIR